MLSLFKNKTLCSAGSKSSSQLENIAENKSIYSTISSYKLQFIWLSNTKIFPGCNFARSLFWNQASVFLVHWSAYNSKILLKMWGYVTKYPCSYKLTSHGYPMEKSFLQRICLSFKQTLSSASKYKHLQTRKYCSDFIYLDVSGYVLSQLNSNLPCYPTMQSFLQPRFFCSQSRHLILAALKISAKSVKTVLP